MLDAAAAKRAVTAAVWAQDDDPWLHEHKQELSDRALERGREQGLEQGLEQGQHVSLLLVLEGRGLHPNDEQRAAIESCTDPARLQRWLRAVGRVASVAELLAMRSPSESY